MRLKITHRTTYTYDTPVHYALQRLRLTPRTGHGQEVISWESRITGGTKQVSYDDPFANHTELVLVDEGASQIEIACEGEVEIEDNHGVIGNHRGYAPLWLFQEPTPRTQPGGQVRRLVRAVDAAQAEADDVARLHALSAAILDEVKYETDRTDSTTTAEAALVAGHGVCQDHAHIMIAAARLLGYPARYISGYLLLEGLIDQQASHAWCEVWTESLGWVGFDVSNGISPDARYVRVAVGREYHDAAPIQGIRLGDGDEHLQVQLQVQQ